MIGSRIGQYRVLASLGEGGMGKVLLVEHAVIGTRFALKMLHDELSNNDMIVQRFLNEARAASAIGHRNVVEISNVDQVEGGGPWYLVMKYLEGQTLAKFLASHAGPVDQRLIVHIIGEALNGLQAAHDRQIVHRDLKPDNFYLTSVKGDPYRIVLLDFGVAQLGHDARLVTKTGAVIGTPQYMAPEQHRGAAIDHRADLWAIGAIVYEMATGRFPYQDDGTGQAFLTGPEIFHRMMTRAPADPRRFNPALTPAFAKAILRALDVDPNRRPATARALAVMLAEATPGGRGAPSGMDVLRQYADELVQGAAPAEPMSSARSDPAAAPLIDSAASRDPKPAADVVAIGPSMSTLGASASQVGLASRPVRGLRLGRALGLGLGVAIVTAIVAATVVARVAGPDAPSATATADVNASAGPAASIRVEDAVTAPDEPTAHVSAAGVPPDASAVVPADVATVAPRDAAVNLPDAGLADAAAVHDARQLDAATPWDAPVKPPVDARLPDETMPGDAGPVSVVDAATRDAAPAAQQSVAMGRLHVVILPWAEVWVDGKPLGQTPVQAKLTAGPHRVRLKNDTKDKTVTVTIIAAKTTLIDETW